MKALTTCDRDFASRYIDKHDLRDKPPMGWRGIAVYAISLFLAFCGVLVARIAG